MSLANGNLVITPDAPAYHIDEFVDEVLARFPEPTRVAMRESIKALVTGFVDQLWLKGLQGDMPSESDAFSYEFLDDGRMVLHLGQTPAAARPW